MKYYITQKGQAFVNEVSPELVSKIASSRVAREKYNVDRAAQRAGAASTGAEATRKGYAGTSTTGTGPHYADRNPGVLKAKVRLASKQDQAKRVLDKVSARKYRGV